MLDILVPAYYIIASAEMASNLSRYDGIRYGRIDLKDGDLISMQKHFRGRGFGSEVVRRILFGTFVQSAEYSNAYYEKALKIRGQWAKKPAESLSGFDALIMPVVSEPAGLLGEEKTPVAHYLEDVFTVPANLAGVPALSFPFCLVNDMPVGLQLIGTHLSDKSLLSTADVLHRGL